MCGRYFVDDEMWREIKKICKQIDDSKLKVTRGDVRPTDMAVVLMGMKCARNRCSGDLPSSIRRGYLSMQEQRQFFLNRLFGIVCGIADA